MFWDVIRKSLRVDFLQKTWVSDELGRCSSVKIQCYD